MDENGRFAYLGCDEEPCRILNRDNDRIGDARRRLVAEASELLVSAAMGVSEWVVVRLSPYWTRFASANSPMEPNS